MVTCIRGEYAELVSVAIDPGERRSGAATVLMTSTLRRLRLRGIRRLRLMVRAGNRAARAFYEKFGFRALRKVPRYYENGGDGVLMSKEW